MSEYKWRPKELIEARKKYCREQFISCESEDDVCEGCDTSLNFFAGADAMLEAVVKEMDEAIPEWLLHQGRESWYHPNKMMPFSQFFIKYLEEKK
jgi:hypothetical protein